MARWLEVEVILQEVHSELEAQAKQFGDHVLPTDLPDSRDELIQLAARVVHTTYLLDRARAESLPDALEAVRELRDEAAGG